MVDLELISYDELHLPHHLIVNFTDDVGGSQGRDDTVFEEDFA
jgi:hypothetical protein